jgi:uncharacterized protein YigE (DUF2233 family)
VRFALLLFCWALLEVVAAWTLWDEHSIETGDPPVRLVVTTISGAQEVRLHVAWPDPERTGLIVLDNPGNARRLDEVMKERGCLAGVNGGYFHPDTTPLGLVVSEGRKVHPLERARLLSGLLVMNGKEPALLRVGEFSRAAPLSDALQAGPFLVDRGEPVRGLDATKQARRTVVLTDDSGRYGLTVAESPVTLADLAAILATRGIVHESRVVRALNLDGGSSSAFWARTSSGEVYLREAKRVRNFLCVSADR